MKEVIAVPKIVLYDMRRMKTSEVTRAKKLSEYEEKQRFVQRIIKAGNQWTDPDFPPGTTSIFDPAIDQKANRSLFSSL